MQQLSLLIYNPVLAVAMPGQGPCSCRQDRLPSSYPAVKNTALEYGGSSRGYAPGSLNKRLAVKRRIVYRAVMNTSPGAVFLTAG